MNGVTLTFLIDMFPDTGRVVDDLTRWMSMGGISGITACANKETEMIVSGIRIRNVELLPFQILGIIIGLHGAFILRNIQNKAWFWALMYFGLMNTSSIFCHNLLEKHSLVWDLTRIFDIAFTGSSSLCLALEAFKSPFFGLYIGPLVLFVIALVGDFQHRWLPFTAEFVYLGMMLLAAIVQVPRFLKMRQTMTIRRLWVLGLIIIPVSIIMDGLLCKIGSPFGAIHLVFFGSDLCLLACLLVGLKEEKKKVE